LVPTVISTHPGLGEGLLCPRYADVIPVRKREECVLDNVTII